MLLKAAAFAVVASFALASPMLLPGVASQISTYSSPAQFGPEFALDCNTDNLRYANTGTIQHTDLAEHAWWRIMFGQAYLLDTVAIWNRMDAAAIAVPRINPFSIYLLDANGNKISHPYSGLQFAMDQKSWTGQLGGVQAAGLQVELDGTNYLHMAQVQVYGTSAPAYQPAGIVANPEPGTLGLMGLAGAALLLISRRNARS